MKDYESDFDYKGVFAYSYEESFKIRRNDLAKIIPIKEKSKENTLDNKIKLNTIINEEFPKLKKGSHLSNDTINNFRKEFYVRFKQNNYLLFEDKTNSKDSGKEYIAEVTIGLNKEPKLIGVDKKDYVRLLKLLQQNKTQKEKRCISI